MKVAGHSVIVIELYSLKWTLTGDVSSVLLQTMEDSHGNDTLSEVFYGSNTFEKTKDFLRTWDAVKNRELGKERETFDVGLMIWDCDNVGIPRVKPIFQLENIVASCGSQVWLLLMEVSGAQK